MRDGVVSIQVPGTTRQGRPNKGMQSVNALRCR